MSSDLPTMSDSPGSKELSIAIPQSSGRPSRPPSIEGLEFSPLPPAVEDEPQQLFTPIEPSNALFELGTAEPPTWSLDDDGVDAAPVELKTILDRVPQDAEGEEEGKPKQEDQRQIISTIGSTPASISPIPSYEPTPTLKPQESFSPPSSLSTHTSTSSFSASSTNLNPTENQHRKRQKRKMDTRLQPHKQTSLEEEEK